MFNKVYFSLINSVAFVTLKQFVSKASIKRRKSQLLTEVKLQKACHYSNSLSESDTHTVLSTRMEGYPCNYFFYSSLLGAIA